MSNKEISVAAMKLPPKRRAQLAEKLLDSLNSEERDAIDAAWALEVEARIADIDNGKTKTIPLSKTVHRFTQNS
jgi:putative addiction module component (TIGR02574 family)